MSSGRRFSKGTMIRVWRTTLSQRLKNGPQIDHQKKVYEGPERRAKSDRRKGLNTQLARIDRMWEEMRSPKDGNAVESAVARLELNYLGRGRRKNSGFRVIRPGDIGNTISGQLHNTSLMMAGQIESGIKGLMQKGVSRTAVVHQLIIVNSSRAIINRRGTFIGFVCAKESVKDNVTIVVYNPFTKNFFWASTRRTKLTRREPERNITIEAWSPSGDYAKNN